MLLVPLVVGGLLRVVCGLTDDVPTTDATAYLRSGESIWAAGAVGLVVPLAFFVQPRYLIPATGIAVIFAGLGLARLPMSGSSATRATPDEREPRG